jgi:hypothetical protein
LGNSASSPFGQWLHIPYVSSQPANRDICPAGIRLFQHFSQLSDSLQELPRGYLITFEHLPAASLYVFSITLLLFNSI